MIEQNPTNGEAEQQAKPVNEIVIRLHPDGQMEVQAPIDNKILCYGMLEFARDIIAQAKVEPKIIGGGGLNFFRRLRQVSKGR